MQALVNIAIILSFIIAVSIIAFWKTNPVLFMVLAAVSFMGGLSVFNIQGDNFFLTVSLVLIVYSFAALGSAQYFIWTKKPQKHEEE